MKKVVFLAGLPGVGKSTIARKLAEKTGGSVLDIDRIKGEVVDPSLVASVIDPPDVRWKCYKQAADEVSFLFEQGASTIFVDEVFHLQSLRERLEALCTQRNMDVLWVEVQCPYEEVENRLRSNGRDGHILSTEEALRMNLLFRELFEPFPQDKANHLTFRNEAGCDVCCLV